MRRLLTSVFLLFLAGCGMSADVMMVDPTPRPAKADWIDVEALLEAPERSYKRIAVISVSDDGNGYSFNDIRERVQQEAAAVGADAVIIGMPSTDPGGAVVVPVGDTFIASEYDIRRLQGIAIVWDGG